MTRVFDAYAAYYDLFYKDKDYAAESEYVRKLLAQHGVSGGEILELGCGTGQHAHHFARVGFTVRGVDISTRMVELADARKPSELADRLDFRVGDVRSVRLEKLFDAVISLFHVVSYQITNSDLAAMFKTAGIHLKPGGIFLFDCWYGPAVLADPPVVRVKRMKSERDQVLRIAEPQMFPNDNRVDVHYTVQVSRGAGAIPECIEETHQMRYLFRPELAALLSASGLALLEANEWMSGKPLGFDTWLATLVAVKL